MASETPIGIYGFNPVLNWCFLGQKRKMAFETPIVIPVDFQYSSGVSQPTSGNGVRNANWHFWSSSGTHPKFLSPKGEMAFETPFVFPVYFRSTSSVSKPVREKCCLKRHPVFLGRKKRCLLAKMGDMSFETPICTRKFKCDETLHLIGAYNDLYFDFIKWGSSIALYVFGLSLSSASKSSSALVVGPFPYGLNSGWIPRNLKFSFLIPNCHWWGKITKMITWMNTTILTDFTYNWLFKIFTKIAIPRVLRVNS